MKRIIRMKENETEETYDFAERVWRIGDPETLRRDVQRGKVKESIGERSGNITWTSEDEAKKCRPPLTTSVSRWTL